MGSTMNYKIGHYYKRVYHDNCWIVFRVIDAAHEFTFMRVHTMKATGFMEAAHSICLLHRTASEGWNTVEVDDEELIWEVL